MAEWLGKGLQNPVPRFDSGCRLSEWRSEYGRLAQGESASLTRKRSVVRIHYRPHQKVLNLQAKRRARKRPRSAAGALVQQRGFALRERGLHSLHGLFPHAREEVRVSVEGHGNGCVS